jgi:O-antigen/teichoic acid export membrane protein
MSNRVRGQFHILVQGVGANYVATFAGIACSIIQVPLLIAGVGSEAYGLYAATGTIMIYLHLLFGSGYVVPKYVAEFQVRKDMDSLRRLTSSFFFAFLAAALLLILLASFALPLVPHIFKTSPGLVHVAKVVFFLTVTNFSTLLPFAVLSGVLYGIQQVHLTYWLELLFSILNLISMFVLLKMGKGLIAISFGTLGARLLVTAVLVVLVRARCPEIRVSLEWFDGKLLRDLLSPAFHYMAINVSTLLIFSTDNVIISSFAAVAAVTAYSIVSRLCKLPLGLILSVGKVLFPHISELDALKDTRRLRSLHTLIAKYSLLMGLTTCTCLAAFGKRVIVIWVGGDNFAGMPVLLTLSLLIPIHTLVQSSSFVLMGMAQHVKLSWVLMFEGVVNVCLSILMLQHMGVWGVALATLVSRLAVSFWFAPWYACRVLGQPFVEYLAGVAPALLPTLPCTALAILVGRVSLSPWLAIPLGSAAIALAYVAFFLLFSVRKPERELLWKRMRDLLRGAALGAESRNVKSSVGA